MLTVLITCILGSISGISFLIGWFSDQQDAAEQDAADTFRQITHRNGVTAPSPWSSPTAPVNAPGLIRTYPHSQRPPVTHSPVQPARPALPSIEKPVEPSVSPASELPALPLEFSDEPNETEAAVIKALLDDGSSMTRIIKVAWGISSGGSKRYANARARYQHYLSEVKPA
ncbi:MAG: hypothetical protein AAFQ63_09035 [Cyanobacteria bacterium J06621_11]